MISLSECGVVLFVVFCGVVWFNILLCGVRLVLIERSTSDNHIFNQWFRRQRCRSGNM